MNKAIFIDKDGTLVEDIPYNVNPDLVRFTTGAIEGLKALKENGYLLIVVSNQSGIAHGFFKEQALEQLKVTIQEILLEHGVQLDGFFFCPHHPLGMVPEYSKACDCRKPEPGMILRAAEQFKVDLTQSWMIGDILNDVQAGNAAGCQTILINNGNETEWDFSGDRHPTAVAAHFSEAAKMIINQRERYEQHNAISEPD